MTAANADKWIPVNPGWEGYLALSIAQVIIAENLQAPGVNVDQMLGDGGREILDAFRPEVTAPLAGLTPEIAGGDPAEFIRRLARDFATKTPSIAITGGPAGAHSNGLFNLQAAAVLNWLTGSVGAPGGVILNPPGPWESVPSSAVASGLDDSPASRSGSAAATCVCSYCITPTRFTACPHPSDCATPSKAPPICSSSAFPPLSTTPALWADLLLPDRVYLEDWGNDIPDPAPGYQTAGFQQPVVNPVWDLDPRSFPDVLLAAAAELGLTEQLPWPSYRAMLREAADALFAENRGSIRAADADEFWTNLLRRGVWHDEAAVHPERNPRPRAGLLREIAQSASPPTFAGYGGRILCTSRLSPIIPCTAANWRTCPGSKPPPTR